MYILLIRNGEKSHSRATSYIQMKIRGSKNQMYQLTLKTDQINLFERNQLDTFAIIDLDLGDLLEMS